MAVITTRDAASLLEIVHEAAAISTTAPFPAEVLESVIRLIPSDASGGFQAVDVARCCTIVERVELVGAPSPPAVDAAARAFYHQNPLAEAFRATERRSLRLSDFYTRRQLTRLEFYHGVWKPLGIYDGLRMWLTAPAGHAYAVYLERGGRNYTDREKTLFALLRPHFDIVRANASFRARGRGAYGLTAREAEVLGWVAQGKTNAQIARILFVSPHTVRKHLENVFEKLGVHTRTAAATHSVADALVARFNGSAASASPV